MFIRENSLANANIEEIVNLMLLKIKMLHEEQLKSSLKIGQNNLLLETRMKLCFLLIDMELNYSDFDNLDEKQSKEIRDKVDSYIRNFSFLDLRTEVGINKIKNKLYEEGLNIILSESVEFFPDVIKRLVEVIPSLGLVFTIIKELEEYYSQNCGTNRPSIGSNQEKKSSSGITNIKLGCRIEFKTLVSEIMVILRKHNRYKIIKELFEVYDFKVLSIEEILDYNILLFSQIENQTNTLKIETSLSETKLLKLYEELYDIENQRISPDGISFCGICKKGITELRFYHFEEVVFHTECYEASLNNKNN